MSAVLGVLLLGALFAAGSRLLYAEDRALLRQRPLQVALVGLAIGIYLFLSDESSTVGRRLEVGLGLTLVSLVTVMVLAFKSQPFGRATEHQLDLMLHSQEFQDTLTHATSYELAKMLDEHLGFPTSSPARATLVKVITEEFSRRGLPVPKPQPRLSDRSA
jgi:hypothetical protein